MEAENIIELRTPVKDYTVRVVDRETNVGRLLFPDIIDRAMKFIDKYNAPTDHIWLSDLLFRAFISQSTDVIMMAGTMNEHEEYEGKIVAHLIGQIQYVGRDPYAFIVQVETDEGSEEIMEKGFTIFENWARIKKAKGFGNMALSEPLMRLWKMKYNFKVRGYLMTMDLGEEGSMNGYSQTVSQNVPQGKTKAEEAQRQR